MEPQLEVSDYAALVHDPDAGYADPIATAHGFAAAAAVEGAKVFDDRTVASIATRSGRVVGVRGRGAGLLKSGRGVVAARALTRWLVVALRTATIKRRVSADVYPT